MWVQCCYTESESKRTLRSLQRNEICACCLDFMLVNVPFKFINNVFSSVLVLEPINKLMRTWWDAFFFLILFSKRTFGYLLSHVAMHRMTITTTTCDMNWLNSQDFVEDALKLTWKCCCFLHDCGAWRINSNITATIKGQCWTKRRDLNKSWRQLLFIFFNCFTFRCAVQEWLSELTVLRMLMLILTKYSGLGN